jgi:hypothetical protein
MHPFSTLSDGSEMSGDMNDLLHESSKSEKNGNKIPLTSDEMFGL